MVGIGTALLALGIWVAFVWWRRRDIPKTPWFLRAVAVSGAASIVALWCGWIVTEVGRQPWIVQGYMRTSEAVTEAEGIWFVFGFVLVLYAALGTTAILILRGMSRRWREAGAEAEADAPYAPPTASGGEEVSKADAAAAILWVGATFYALFGGADFGGGFWDLIAGDAEKGERPRALIQRSLTPVWEANHVWLIFILVVLWTAFPPAFSAVMTTLYVPLTLAAIGIVLRGAGFAFRKSIEGLQARRAAGATFALSSVLTPFFMGTVVGAIASGNVPADGNGDAFSSWLEPLPLLTGAMFVATGAYLSAVFLVGDARRAGEAGHGALLRAPSARRRRRRRGRRRGRPGRASRRSPLRLRPPHRPGAAAGDPLGALRDRAAGPPRAPAALLSRIARQSAPSPPGAAPARRRRGRRSDLGLGRRPVPLPAADQPADRPGRGPRPDPDRDLHRLRAPPRWWSCPRSPCSTCSSQRDLLEGEH